MNVSAKAVSHAVYRQKDCLELTIVNWRISKLDLSQVLHRGVFSNLAVSLMRSGLNRTDTMTRINTARRAFLRGKAVGLSHHVPWAVEAFVEVCDRCGECVSACKEAVLTFGDGGFPTVDHRLGACTLCGACVEVCSPGALDRRVDPAWTIRPRVDDSCLSLKGVTCRSCGDSCESGAISFRLLLAGRADPVVDGARCNGCGACVAACPNYAIRMEEGA